ncbi:MAG: hypothetical protein LH610_11960 [Sphingomonas bacterium]|nr:hypothetical protein [Sphingomonas bacterium]
MIEDEGALALVEAGASCYLAEAAIKALIDEYVEHLRTVGIEQLQRRPRAKRIAVARPSGSLCLPTQLPARLRGLDPVEVEKLEQTLARNRELIERRLFDTTTLDQLGTDTGITKERIRQITKRAARTIGELLTSQPKFAVMAAHEVPHRPAAQRSKPGVFAAASPVAVSILPELDLPHNRMTKVIEAAPGDTASLYALAERRDAAYDGEGAADLVMREKSSER